MGMVAQVTVKNSLQVAPFRITYRLCHLVYLQFYVGSRVIEPTAARLQQEQKGDNKWSQSWREADIESLGEDLETLAFLSLYEGSHANVRNSLRKVRSGFS